MCIDLGLTKKNIDLLKQRQNKKRDIEKERNWGKKSSGELCYTVIDSPVIKFYTKKVYLYNVTENHYFKTAKNT